MEVNYILKMRFKKNIAILSAVLTFAMLAGSVLCYKKVQASQLDSNFKTALSQRNYQTAREIFNKANNDLIIKSFFSFNNDVKKLVASDLVLLQKDYINNKINYKQYSENVKAISAFECISGSSVNLSSAEVKKIEDARQAYSSAESQYNAKKYYDALLTLNSIPDVDKALTAKVASLKELTKSSYVNDIKSSIDTLAKAGKYTDALKLLSDNKSMFSDADYNNKTDAINTLIQNKIVADNTNNQKVNRGEESDNNNAYLSSLLAQHISDPAKENTVKNISSSTIFLIWVNLSEQTTNIFVGQKGNWSLIKSYLSSTGKPGDDTPKGTFSVTGRGLWFFNSSVSEGAQYYTQFYGNYLFHSYPMDKNKNITDTTLGTPASHGCVRMDTANAKWIYNNVPDGTKVIIN